MNRNDILLPLISLLLFVLAVPCWSEAKSRKVVDRTEKEIPAEVMEIKRLELAQCVLLMGLHPDEKVRYYQIKNDQTLTKIEMHFSFASSNKVKSAASIQVVGNDSTTRYHLNLGSKISRKIASRLSISKGAEVQKKDLKRLVSLLNGTYTVDMAPPF